LILSYSIKDFTQFIHTGILVPVFSFPEINFAWLVAEVILPQQTKINLMPRQEEIGDSKNQFKLTNN
jgi:hypothetical protein